MHLCYLQGFNFFILFFLSYGENPMITWLVSDVQTFLFKFTIFSIFSHL